MSIREAKVEAYTVAVTWLNNYIEGGGEFLGNKTEQFLAQREFQKIADKLDKKLQHFKSKLPVKESQNEQ